MANNVYCTVDQFFERHDQRTASQLTNDRGDGTILRTRLQNLLDSEASFLDSILAGRYDVPLTGTPPPMLTNYVADKTMIQLYGRRADRPASFDRLEERWDNWVQMLISGDVQLPNIARNNATIELVAAEQSGQTRFNNLPDFDQAIEPVPTQANPTPNLQPPP